MKIKFLSRAKQRKAERDKAMIAMYRKHIASAQSKMALYESIAEYFGVSESTVTHLILKELKDETNRN